MMNKTSNDESKFSFLAEWLDTQASIVRKYHLFYYKLDGSIEMYDIKNRRTFLKKCVYPNIQLSDLFVGATVAVYSRQLRVVEFGDEYTRNELGCARAKALAVVKPEGVRRLGDILDSISRARLTVANLKMTQLTSAQACEFFGAQFPNERTNSLLGGPVVAIEVVGENAGAKVRHILTQAEGKAASDPFSQSQILAANAQRDPQQELDFFFKNPQLASGATFRECSVCVVRPHALQAGLAGSVVSRLHDAGFDVTAAQLFALDKAAASEFLEVYNSVVPEFNAMVEQLASGACLALEVVRKGGQTVPALRELCGPSDPAIGKAIRPGSLRADFGQNKVLNAVHCTDLPEDGFSHDISLDIYII